MRIERVELRDVRGLFREFHGYKSSGGTATYAFGVIEPRGIVAAYLWQPPPFGCAKSVCPEAPGAVLSLSHGCNSESGPDFEAHFKAPPLANETRDRPNKVPRVGNVLGRLSRTYRVCVSVFGLGADKHNGKPVLLGLGREAC